MRNRKTSISVQSRYHDREKYSIKHECPTVKRATANEKYLTRCGKCFARFTPYIGGERENALHAVYIESPSYLFH